MIRLVISDMDGTLLDGEGKVPHDLFEVLDALHEQGVLFAVASGRQYGNLRGLFAPVRDRIAFVCENGALVVWQDEVLSRTPMSRAAVRELVNNARSAGKFEILLCTADAAYHESERSEFLDSVNHYYSSVVHVPDLQDLDAEFLKVVFWHPDGIESRQAGLAPLPAGVKTMVSGFNYIDCMNVAAHKGHAVTAVQEYFGISPEETMVFGDYLNDLEMMAVADHSHAMANAHPEILAAARFRAPANTENGVLHTIRLKVLDQSGYPKAGL